MNNIVDYNSMLEITTYDNEKYLLTGKIEKKDLLEMINASKFISVGDDIIAVSSIKKIGKREIDEIETFILSQDSKQRKCLRKLVDERNKHGLSVNGPKHLQEIALKRGLIQK